MQVTTFNQIIDGETYTITVPQNRVEAIINRVDRFINKNKFEQALGVIQPFIGAVVAVNLVKQTKTNRIDEIIENNRDLGRYTIINKLVQEAGISKASAYYRVSKAGIN